MARGAVVAAVALLVAPHTAGAASKSAGSRTAAPPAASTAIVGTWEGKLAGHIRFVLHVQRDSTGALRSSADSPDQHATGLEVDSVAVVGDSLHFTMTKLGGGYDGLMNAARTEIDGTWHQGGAAVLLVFHPYVPGSEPEQDGGVQEPKPPFPYDAIDVTYPNPAAKDVILAGTLTLPKGAAGVACAILITGSGPEDRDETLFGHKPFLVLADYLTRHGIAVLRSDDRGVGGSSGTQERATSDDFAGDVRAAVAFLKGRKDVDPTKIGLIGHSEGGLIAPMVAASDKSLGFIVLLAGPGVPGDSILITQSLLISKSMGYSDSMATSAQNAQRELIVAAKSAPDSATLAAKLKVVIRGQIERLPKDQQEALGDLDKIAASQAQLLRAPWMQFFLSHDPRPVLAQVQCPVLALNGDKDVQISAEQNLPAIREALLKGGNKDATVEAIPGLNHLFQTSRTGSLAEYQTIRETFSPVALQKIGDWIGARMGRGK
jgi:pimeloyl-ACP methyl ester carboxylesterase